MFSLPILSKQACSLRAYSGRKRTYYIGKGTGTVLDLKRFRLLEPTQMIIGNNRADEENNLLFDLSPRSTYNNGK